MSTQAPARDLTYTIARIVTESLAPAILIAVQLVAVGWHAGATAGTGRWWGVVAALFAAVLPFGYVVRAVRRGQLTDHHIQLREQRHIPLAFGIGSVLTGLILLIALGAPRDLLALLAAGGTGLAVLALITRWWKMSIHSAVAGGTVAVLVAVYGPAMLPTAPLVALVGWSRVRLTAHTPAQVITGTLVGTVIAAVVFPALR
ncbi:MAG TPA: phosphatase PAP2 family protein [Pilimelia sp.]|nr:phosphatase PAP2 family protein [Pilimelia sp.]